MSEIRSGWTKAGLSVDVDDILWAFVYDFKVKKVKEYKSEIRRELKKTLELLASYNAKGTFFIPGYILEKVPDILELFVETEHEIACHGYKHIFLTRLTPEQFEEDIYLATTLIKKYSGRSVLGYRAPGLTLAPVSNWAVPILLKYGIKYSSSVPALALVQHKFLNMSSQPFYWDGKLLELPLSSYCRIPVCGSFYSRIIPHYITAHMTRKFIKKSRYPLFYYFHPFEAFPENLTVVRKSHPFKSRLYFLNCKNYLKKLKWVLAEVEFCTYFNIVQELELEKVKEEGSCLLRR